MLFLSGNDDGVLSELSDHPQAPVLSNHDPNAVALGGGDPPIPRLQAYRG